MRNIKFLVVDDFSTMRLIIKNLLKDIGYENIEEADDGAKAIKKLSDGKFDLVISDINMPVVNGFQLLSYMKEDPKLKSIPVLMVTAEARKEDIVMAAKLGAAGYIVKPFTKMLLEDKIRMVIQKSGLHN